MRARARNENKQQEYLQILLGGIREGEIPDPISNSEVKPFIANGTAHKSVEE